MANDADLVAAPDEGDAGVGTIHREYDRTALGWFGCGAVMGAILTVGTLLVTGALRPVGMGAQLHVGSPAPDFTLNTLDGQTVTLNQLRGKRVLLNFCASWCAPCRKEVPDFNAAYGEMKEQGVEFIGIGTRDNPDSLRQFLRETPVDYTIVEDADGRVGDAYGVLGLPMTVFVDSAGVIQRVHTGPLTKADVLQTFAALK